MPVAEAPKAADTVAAPRVASVPVADAPMASIPVATPPVAADPVADATVAAHVLTVAAPPVAVSNYNFPHTVCCKMHILHKAFIFIVVLLDVVLVH